MIIMVYSTFTARSIDTGLGKPEYSYWFVRRAFWPMLERFGVVVPVTDPAREVPAIRATAARDGQDCVFFSFDPPHKTELDLGCPTVPVFAWEFDTIPDTAWEDEPRNDWRLPLGATGLAITHSSFAATTVRATMGADYPVWSIPAPVHEAKRRHAVSAAGVHPETVLRISGIAFDAGRINRDLFSMQRAHEDGMDVLRALDRYLAADDRPDQAFSLGGVVYTAIFNPSDGRKNWTDLLQGFVWAFRDTPDATLVLKITHSDVTRGLGQVLHHLAKVGDFSCRVLLLQGMLPDDQFDKLLEMTSYIVNTSTNEGQCLPLMEFMSAGRPAITPDHTSMRDYATTENAFLLRCCEKPVAWPHDPLAASRTVLHSLDFVSLLRAYRESYAVAKHDPARYAAMSAAATAAQEAFCGDAVVQARLGVVLEHIRAGRDRQDAA
jgi:glycosyltransferase involved in cell wall biosynthesis